MDTLPRKRWRYAYTNVCLTRVLVSSHTQHTHTHTHTHTQIKRLPGLGSFGHFRHSNSSHLLHHHYLYPRLLLLYGLLQHRRLRRPVCEGPAQKCAAPSMTSVVCAWRLRGSRPQCAAPSMTSACVIMQIIRQHVIHMYTHRCTRTRTHTLSGGGVCLQGNVMGTLIGMSETHDVIEAR